MPEEPCKKCGQLNWTRIQCACKFVRGPGWGSGKKGSW